MPEGCCCRDAVKFCRKCLSWFSFISTHCRKKIQRTLSCCSSTLSGWLITGYGKNSQPYSLRSQASQGVTKRAIHLHNQCRWIEFTTISITIMTMIYVIMVGRFESDSRVFFCTLASSINIINTCQVGGHRFMSSYHDVTFIQKLVADAMMRAREFVNKIVMETLD